MIQRGIVTPDRTTLIASTHRSYSIGEKSHRGEGRADGERILQQSREQSRRFVSFDMAEVASRNNAVISAVLLGAIAGASGLPFQLESYRRAIRDGGIAVDRNLAAFDASVKSAREAADGSSNKTVAPATPSVERIPEALRKRIESELPPAAQSNATHGVARLIDYQDAAYAKQYLDSLQRIAALEPDAAGAGKLTAEVARGLALWMSFEDTIRVADLKTRSDRKRRVLAATMARPGQLVHVVEFMSPRVEEICGTLPAGMGRAMRASRRWSSLISRVCGGRQLRTSTVSGYLLLRSLSGLRRWRRGTLRFTEEHARIARWLDQVAAMARKNYDVAVELAGSPAPRARLRGYVRARTARFRAIVPNGDATGRQAGWRAGAQAAACSRDGWHMKRIVCLGGGPAGLYSAILLQEGAAARQRRGATSATARTTPSAGAWCSPTRPWKDSRTSIASRTTPSSAASTIGTTSTCTSRGSGSAPAAMDSAASAASICSTCCRSVPPTLGVKQTFQHGDSGRRGIRRRGPGGCRRWREQLRRALTRRSSSLTSTCASAASSGSAPKQHFPAFTFAFEQTEHGWFQIHAYQFSARLSTVIVETREETWQAHGLDRFNTDQSIAFCEQLFAHYLGGHSLMSNAQASARLGLAQFQSRAVRALAPRQYRPDRRCRTHGAFRHRLGHQARHGRCRVAGRSVAHATDVSRRARLAIRRSAASKHSNCRAPRAIAWSGSRTSPLRAPRAGAVCLQPAHRQPAHRACQPAHARRDVSVERYERDSPRAAARMDAASADVPAVPACATWSW